MYDDCNLMIRFSFTKFVGFLAHFSILRLHSIIEPVSNSKIHLVVLNWLPSTPPDTTTPGRPLRVTAVQPCCNTVDQFQGRSPVPNRLFF